MSVTILPGRYIVNQPHDPKSVNVYILKPSDFGDLELNSLPKGRLSECVSAVRHNIIALPPDTILVDEYLLEQLLLSSLGGQTSEQNGILFSVLYRNIENPLHEAPQVYASAMANMLRRSWLLALFGDKLSTKEGYELGMKKLLDGWKSTGPHSDSEEAYRSTLAVIFLHESAHLTGGDLGGFLSEWVSKLLFGPSVRSREEAADRVAIDLFKRYIEKGKGKSRLAQAAGLAGLSDYLALSILAEATEGIRSLGAADLGVIFDHFPCDQWKSHLKEVRQKFDAIVSSLSDKEGADAIREQMVVRDEEYLNFINPFLMKAAVSTDLFPITASEFSDLVKKVGKSASDESHPHNFLRSEAFSELADVLSFDKKSDPASQQAQFKEWRGEYYNQAIEILDAVKSNDPLKMRPPASLVQGTSLGIKKDELVDVMGRLFVFEDAVNCPAGECFVGRLKSGRRGFLEIVTNGKDVTRVRLAMQIDQDHDDQFFSDKALESAERREEIAIDLFTINAVAYGQVDDTDEGGREASAFVGEAFKKVQEQKTSCGIASFDAVFRGARILEYSLNSDGWYAVVAGPA
ncbi:hypothetical protein Q3C01_32155 [Bradyrhizobium sp. UFLA05-109]